MIPKIIEYSARNKFIIFLLVGFLTLWGYFSLKTTPLDALPDLSDTQVIIYTDWQGRSPDLIEDQITYPIVTTLLAAPRVQAVRGYSYLGSSFIYVIFDEGTDIYWARARINEYIQAVRNKIPQDANPILGPDATSLGWGFEYAIVDHTGKHNLAELRTIQDYNLKLALESVPGVSQVASVGGFVKQYQITIDPVKLQAYNLPLTKVLETIRKNNRDVEGRVLEFSGFEYMVRGRGYIKNLKDIENISVGTNGYGTPIYMKDVATIQLGPEIRRGLTELNGEGEVAGGIVIVRFGENVLNVIEKVKSKLKTEIEPSLPKGVHIVTTYDRSDLIYRSIDTLKEEILKLSLAVSAVCIVFLWHFPSALVVILTLPVAIIMSFILMSGLGVTSNIMSLSGIAIAIGAMVDASIIMVENAHKRLEEWEQQGKHGSRMDVIIEAAKEVGPSLFFSLLVITVGFLPIFTLEAQAGRLFKPLAYTKTFAMLFSSFLAITLTPVLMTLFIRGKILPEEKNPLGLILHKIYEPVVKFSLKFKKIVIFLALVLIGLTAYPLSQLGSEFMPPLYEGTMFYMPVTAPGLSIPEAGKLLQLQDKLIKRIPEVQSVFGKAGRAETPTDPAPPEMFETVINLKPESEWRKGLTQEMLTDELNDVLTIPGVANSFTMPIKARIDMLATGIRTPVGIKIMGPNLQTIEDLGKQIENNLKNVQGTRSVYAERVNTGYFLDIKVNRQEAARYGLSVDEVQEIIQSAIGGMNLTVTIEGRQRYPVNVRYMRDFRSDIDTLKRVLIPLENNNHILLGQLADISFVPGPTNIKSEAALPTAYVYIDVSGRDIGGYVKEAKQKLASLDLPEGYRLVWSGEYEYLTKTQDKLKLVIPLTAFIIFVLIFLNTKSWVKTMIVFLAVPFSLVGSFWFLYLLNYNLSIAVWVGIIALAGLDAETGVVMLLYLDLAYEEWKKKGLLTSISGLKDAIMHGAVKRIRPKIMTVSVILAGLVPIMFSHGAGSDVMKRIAAPMVGGVVTSTILELIIYPAIYMIWRGREFKSQ
ncbi:MAG: cation transporter [Candidatus Melainabacteria bacterium GWF2_37_15]|nr:MAG: cation transporter [Candidatus Melainabacteria bacterium GWF2_37_15]